MKAHLKAIPALVLLLFATFAFATPQEVAPKPEWKPPTPRKSKTIFAPKPIAGDNIFKGNAEVWLADATEKWASDDLSPIDDNTITEYVTKVGNYVASQSVAPNKQYRFIVTDDNHKDAMTAGGGRIYITVAMLEALESEDELAAVLAHEIGHDAFAHPGKTLTRQLFWLTGTRKIKSPDDLDKAFAKLIEEYGKKPFAAIAEVVLGFSRFDELEADRAAFYNTYKAGYNPEAMSVLFKRVAKEEKGEMGNGDYAVFEFLNLLFGTHPPTTQRTMALDWESNWVKMPSNGTRHASAAFTAMKTHLSTPVK